tara:strand:+ start:3458 stop:4252 length:795 start_codon:yes stop_codon:yes gene_type:complete
MNIESTIPTIYIGYDSREHDAFEVLKYSILKKSSKPINVYAINQEKLRRMGIYRRAWLLGSSEKPMPKNKFDSQQIDLFDKRPYSTDFSFTRFLIPFLNRYEGWALYLDSDMYFRSDPMEIFEKYNNKSKAIYCVKHKYKPVEKIKMYGTKQIKYPRKNWSSLVLYNCSHKSHENLTIDDVNTKTGRWLHNFKWLKENDIGNIPLTWNWLEGYSSQKISPKNVHFTRGGPWFPNLKFKLRDNEKKYFKEWVNLHKELIKKNSKK